MLPQCEQDAAARCATARVLVVDDELPVRKMLTTLLSQAGVPCSAAANAREALTMLEKTSFQAVISDVRMGADSGFDLLREVRARFPGLAFLMATGLDDVRVGVQAMKLGADDYLLKPFDIEVVLASLQRALERKHLEREVENYRRHLEEMVSQRTQQLQAAMTELEHSHSATLEALGGAIDLRDGPTAGHSRRVLLYSIKIAEAIGGMEDQLKTLGMGAWLHDIGKLAIPDSILLKPAALDEQERQIMEHHVQLGYDLVKGIPFLADAAEIILAHHERHNGSGYPRGLHGKDIPISARIFAVADSFDAMTSHRPYRSALPAQTARRVIAAGRGELFDPEIVDAFFALGQDAWKLISADSQTASILKIICGNGLSLASARALTSQITRWKKAAN
ncbi:MAG TPA: HD domain-containing phosphohydrolase [Candidatus Acidoferrum sp.]